ncbi:hypothetical protein EYC80_000573 [Monilinia laxa]|uniref:Uncharacterized protein n=1 Tax=Monilinia laxa TaxID=61186 RepID=A0A5N6KB67_MONLA|nr:hypothetical protein EYC80_000573 [Monilinia laxa]
MLFQTMAPTADTNVAPSNSSVAKVNPAQQTPALSPSFHVGKKAAHPSEDDSQYSDLQSGKGASLTPQSNSRYSGHNLDESVSSEYLPYSPAEFGGGEDSNTRQEAKLTMKTQPLELARSSSPKNNTANAEAFGIKRSSVPPSAEASHRQRAPASFSGILAHLQGHAATNPRSNELEIAPIAIVKNEEDAPPPHQATPLATNPTHVSFDDELDHLRWEMRRMSRKMARQAACAEVYAADSHARNVDANRKIAQFDGVLAALRNEVVGLRSEVLGLKIQGLKSERGVELEGLRGEVVRLGFEVIRLERDALRREVGS